MNLDRAVVVGSEQVSNSKVCTSEARGDNESSIGNDNHFEPELPPELELPSMPTEENTLSINTPDKTPSSLAKSSSSTGQSQVQRVSERGNKDQYPQRWMFIATYLADGTQSNEAFEPQTLDQAKADFMWPSWLAAMNDKTQSLLTNTTWTLVPRPNNRRVL